MVDIFPFIETAVAEPVDELPMAREYAWDFELLDFKLREGQPYMVEGNEAIKIWVWKLFSIPRYKHLIYDWDYGNEFEELIGRTYTPDYLEAEIMGEVREMIEYNLGEYILDVSTIEVEVIQSKLRFSLMFTTPYGEVEMDV